MDDKKANAIIDVVQTLMALKESGEILYLKFHWDEENNTLDIHTVPRVAVQYIKCDIILTPTGVDFK